MVRGYFNPRSDERSDTPLFFKMYNKLYFNPRSDERSDIAGQVPVSFSLISIHAPTNGATKYNCTVNKAIHISIHAPTNGATFLLSFFKHFKFYFNPRSDERSDLMRFCVFAFGNRISIHAPTNGATTPTS